MLLGADPVDQLGDLAAAPDQPAADAACCACPTRPEITYASTAGLSMNWDLAGKLQKAQMDVAEISADLDYTM